MRKKLIGIIFILIIFGLAFVLSGIRSVPTYKQEQVVSYQTVIKPTYFGENVGWYFGENIGWASSLKDEGLIFATLNSSYFNSDYYTTKQFFDTGDGEETYIWANTLVTYTNPFNFSITLFDIGDNNTNGCSAYWSNGFGGVTYEGKISILPNTTIQINCTHIQLLSIIDDRWGKSDVQTISSNFRIIELETIVPLQYWQEVLAKYPDSILTTTSMQPIYTTVQVQDGMKLIWVNPI